MRRNIVTILAIAILGILGFYAKSHANSSSNNSSSTVSASPNSSTNSNTSSSGMYKDGTYTGTTAESPYGPIQVAAVISGGKITNIQFLQMPSDHEHSMEVTRMAEPLLKQSTLEKQNATNIDMVSGATSTYYGYQESLQAALDQAKLS